jgi:hypothetical protein
VAGKHRDCLEPLTAATRWAQHVSAQTGTEWRYLLMGETAAAEARGSCPALRKLAEG